MKDLPDGQTGSSRPAPRTNEFETHASGFDNAVNLSANDSVSGMPHATRDERARREVRSLGVVHTWGDGPEIVFLSNPLARPVHWSSGAREQLLQDGYRVTTFEHQSSGNWESVVACISEFLADRRKPVALVGWSQGAAIAQEVALAVGDTVGAVVLIATYGRQNAIDRVLQQAWATLPDKDDDPLRLALGFLSSFSPDRLADDQFVERMVDLQREWAGQPDPDARQRAASFISSYQDRLAALEGIRVPTLVVGLERDTDTFASRAREVALAIPGSEYIELPGLGHAAPISDPSKVWPVVTNFLKTTFPQPSG